MLLAPSSPTSHGESTHESAAPACCRFEAPAGYSMLAGQEPCFDGLCLNEAQESEEALLPQKCVCVCVASDGLGPHGDHPVRTGEYVYWGYDFKPALPPAMPACFTTKSGTVCTVLNLQALGVSVACN